MFLFKLWIFIVKMKEEKKTTAHLIGNSSNILSCKRSSMDAKTASKSISKNTMTTTKSHFSISSCNVDYSLFFIYFICFTR